MAKKKTTPKKKSSPAPKAKTKKKISAKPSKPALKKAVRSRKSAPSKKSAPAKKHFRGKTSKATKARSRGSEPTSQPSARIHQGVGLMAGGQSGDTQGLSTSETVDSESVVELVEEGQDYEAEVVSGVENALDPDQSEVTTKEVPEDDVPLEYQNPEQA